ncbi:polysaccharide deacetylase family protein [Streptomyces sp. B1I3]|uniref:polysaccharide deacetylase family protein n=1 Tax=Streptomyces sp. B1I3 TaxID=3042264 RepID=UPI0027887EED|nr:polysaccharide deacetylase family protein [Streptomyces sp. B1I3]MDQ0792123.1 peptidoglycan/xylan/chitin deacetylase (PgdA/CDA1 family) [Streptomyces sp. B1I3]
MRTRGRVLPPAGRLPAALAALALGAHVLPAGTWLPGVRRTLFPALTGLGHGDHVALTFDDGPDPRSTPLFLDALERTSARATFFVLGESLVKYPDIGREIVSRGHELGVHGWTHGRPWLSSFARDTRELARAVEVVAGTAGTAPLWYRPPYGILTAGRWAASVRSGLRPVLWSAWGRDWTADATAASVLAAVRRDVRGGGTVLLHDTDRMAAPGCWRATLAMLPALVHGLRASGLAVGPLAEHGIAGRGAGRRS